MLDESSNYKNLERKASNTPKVEWEIKVKQLQGNKEVN
jgi:hypothetical protein